MKKQIGFCFWVLLSSLVARVPSAVANDGSFIKVSSLATPTVELSVTREKTDLTVVVAVEVAAGERVQVRLGVGTMALSVMPEPTSQKREESTDYTSFLIPIRDIVSSDEDWAALRLALAVEWRNARGNVVRSERYRHTDGRAPYVPMSPLAKDWKPFDLVAYEAEMDDRLNAVRLQIPQPMDGKLTVVIEDGDGNRICNLVSGRAFDRGKTQIPWNCLDEDGNLVKPGTYHWRSISHPGITPDYLFAFANGDEASILPFGPNHNLFEDATINQKYAFLAAPSTEGGECLIAVGEDGMLVHAYKKIHGTGLAGVAVAADETWLYVANDGPGWGQKTDGKGADWKVDLPVCLTRYNVESGVSVDFSGGQRFSIPYHYEWGPGASCPELRGGDKRTLRGMALLNGTLYISVRDAQAILKVDTKTGKEIGRIALAAPGPVASSAGLLFAVSGMDIVRIDPDSGDVVTVVTSAAGKPVGLALDARGLLYVSDGEAHQIKVFSEKGTLVRTLGTPGGPYAGAYDRERLVHPTGLAVFHDTLWVTEKRRNPKRATAWDLKTGKIRLAKYGNPPYGGPGAAFDPDDHTRWIGLRSQWKLDFSTHTATPVSVLQKEGGHFGGLVPFHTNYRFYKEAGRTFLLGMDKINTISELMPDGSLHDLAFYGSGHLVLYSLQWKRVEAFCNAFEKRYPAADISKKYGDERWRYAGVLWVDQNGDGLLQEEEFEIADGNYRFGNGWGDRQKDLSIRIVVDCVNPATKRVEDQRFVTLRPDGFNAAGAPRYPSFDAALQQGVSLTHAPAFSSRPAREPSAIDRKGDILSLSDPMVGINPEGRCLWRFPNPWSGVHGSHKAPLPEVGVMQGTLFFLGMAPLDGESDVFIVNGNHGRFFCLTSDGLYLDEMFNDVRIGAPRDEFLVGGEAFGGFFGKANDDGGYYLQTGGTGYRVYRINGLDKVQRLAGSFTVTPVQLLAAERRMSRKTAAVAEKRDALVPVATGPIDIGAGGRDFDKAWCLEWSNAQFPVQVKLAYDAQNLYLHYAVRDASPWVNTGSDWQTLFKTGDSIDLQLGSDPNARANRTDPVPGDLRLLIAPFTGDPVAVLYRHRLDGDKKHSVIFSSPWRSETVDEVSLLAEAKINVEKDAAGYRVTAAIPLAALGLTTVEGQTLRADCGVLYGDPAGTQTGLRSYWSNKATGMVNDVPGEIMLTPQLWGTLRFARNIGDVEEPATQAVGNVQSMRIALSGIIGNSGESGEGLVKMDPDEKSRGLGAVIDRQGFLWDRAGRGRLHRYAADGRQIASYSIHGDEGLQDQLSLVGDTLVLLVGDRLYTLDINAAEGSVPVQIPDLGVNCMSSNSHEARLAVSQIVDRQESRLVWLDPVTGAVTPMDERSWQNVSRLEVSPAGVVYVVARGEVRKIVGGVLDPDWKRALPGERLQLVNGAWYAHAWHGTVKRFTADFQPAPGVVLGGASGSFIGHLEQNSELDNGRGVCHLGGDLYAIGGVNGVMHLMRWDAQMERMELVRRIGSLRGITGLGLDRSGRIFARSGNWLWEDEPDSVQRFGITTTSTSQCIMLPNDYVLAFARRYGMPGHPALVMGTIDGEVDVLAFDAKGYQTLDLDPRREYYGATWYRSEPGSRGVGVFLLLDDKNIAHAFRVEPGSFRGCYRGNLGMVELKTASPVMAYRSLAMQDADTLLASADGTVIRFARDGSNWMEMDRFAGGEEPFGKTIDISCDNGRLWVADSGRHRVLCYDAKSRTLLASFGKIDISGTAMEQLDTPAAITARGDRCVVYDSGNQRIVKLELKSDSNKGEE